MRSVMLSVVVVGWTALAQAGVVETAASRSILVDADTSLGTHNQDSAAYPALGNWAQDLTIDASDGSVYSMASSFNNTTIGPGSYFGTMYNMASADPGGDIFNIPSGYAESKLSLDFTLTTSMDFTISGLLDAGADTGDDSALAELIIENVGVGGSPTLVIGSVVAADDPLFYNESGTLLPGSYRLDITSLAISSPIFVEYYTQAFSDVSFNMTLTPEPASLALLALGGLVALRRRR